MYGFLSHLHSLMGYDELEIHLSSELLNPSLTGAVIRSIDDDAALMLRVVLLRPRCARYEEGGNQCRYIGELIAGSQSKRARRNIGTGIFSPIPRRERAQTKDPSYSERSYGGSLENRFRLPLRVVEEVKAEMPRRFPLVRSDLRHRLG